jgi:Flp pilus assembly protein TadG
VKINVAFTLEQMIKIPWIACSIVHQALPLVQQETVIVFVCGDGTFKNILGKRLSRAVSLKDRFRRLRKRMRADARRGSAAIDFAFVAPVFFTLLLGTFEGAIMFFSQSALQNAVTTVGRSLRTGQAACFVRNGNTCVAMTANDFKTQVCNQAGMLMPGCAGSLVVTSTVFNGGFGGAAAAPVGGNAAGFAGAACDVMLVRATYPWRVVTPVLSWFLVSPNTPGAHQLVSSLAFRNEPFGGAPC